MTKKPKTRTYTLTCHVCRFCGMGRILQDVTPGYVTGGGNPIWTCTHCDRSCAATGPGIHCYCNWGTRKTQCWGNSFDPDWDYFRVHKQLGKLLVVERK